MRPCSCRFSFLLVTAGCVWPLWALHAEEARTAPSPGGDLPSLLSPAGPKGLLPPPQVAASPQATAPSQEPSGEIVVGLDAVFRLAQEHNTAIARARASVAEAEAQAMVAAHSCVPNALRSEANRKATTEAKLWQQRAELARITREVLEEAGSAYYDWLAARRAEVVAQALLDEEEKVLGRAKALAKDEQPANVVVAGIETAIAGRKQSQHKFQHQTAAAAARLAYLLNLSEKVLVPADSDLTVVRLVPADEPLEDQVQRVRNTGPGIQELLNLEGVVEKAIADSRCLEHGCSLTGRTTFCGRLEAAHAKLEQVRLARVDLAGKLEAGVREAHAAILAARQEINLGFEQAEHARKAHSLANAWLKDMASVQTLNEVLESIRGLESAHYGYLQAVAAHNKAQVRLHVVLGPSAAK